MPFLLACVLVITPSCVPGGTSSSDPVDKYIGEYSLNDDDGEVDKEIIEESTKLLADILEEGSSIVGVQLKLEIIKVDADTASLSLTMDYQVTGTSQLEETSKAIDMGQLKVEGDKLEGTETIEHETITTTVTTTVTLDGNVLNLKQVIKTIDDSGTIIEITAPVLVFTKV